MQIVDVDTIFYGMIAQFEIPVLAPTQQVWKPIALHVDDEFSFEGGRYAPGYIFEGRAGRRLTDGEPSISGHRELCPPAVEKLPETPSAMAFEPASLEGYLPWSRCSRCLLQV